MSTNKEMDKTERVFAFIIIAVWLAGVYISHWWVTIFLIIMVIIAIIGQISLWNKKRKNK